VVFGSVVEGLEVVQAMEAQGTPGGKPRQAIVIVDCGQL
jgi:hypothetical protein